MSTDTGGLEILDAAECWSLLGSAPVGRIVFTDQALPAIQPVNFIVVDGDIVVRTAAGSKLAAATRNAVVAFEADDFDVEAGTGWSVVLTGQARTVTTPEELSALRALPLQPWTPGRREQFVRIRPQLITGRRIPANP